jgi:CRISPR-associated endonuclease/helicase Cas3
MKGSKTLRRWAKLQREKTHQPHRDNHFAITRWLSILDHSADVAACCEGLLGHTLLMRRLARLGGLNDLDFCHQQRLCVLAGYHDIGKFGHGFQNKQHQKPEFVSGHVREVLPFLAGRGGSLQAGFGEAMAFDELADWAEESDTVARLLIASICHHGKPQDVDDREIQKSYWAPTKEADPIAGISELTTALKSWFPLAWTGNSWLPEHPQFQHGFSGLVMLADWIGSDTNFFALEEIDSAQSTN